MVYFNLVNFFLIFHNTIKITDEQNERQGESDKKFNIVNLSNYLLIEKLITDYLILQNKMLPSSSQ